MGDSRKIDMLRALALSSMPSLSRRTMQRQNSRQIVEERRFFGSALPAKSDDKEEGELSSDDDNEHTTTPFATVESLSSFGQGNAGLSLHAPSDRLLKDERHISAATPSESAPYIAVPSTSAPTRVSFINKAQLFTAFTAQAPPLISSRIPGPVQDGSEVGIPEKQVKGSSVQETSSTEGLYNSAHGPSNGDLGCSLGAASSAIVGVTSTVHDGSLSQANPNVASPKLGPQNGRLCDLTELPLLSSAQVPISAAPIIECTVPKIVGPCVTPDASSLSASTTACGGSEVLTSVGTARVVKVSAHPGVGSVGVQKEVGVRKEAEAFLASLRIPLSSSSPASGDENEDAFVIKFDEDSDSDGENEKQLRTSSIYHRKSTHKEINGSSGPLNTNVLLPGAPVISNQSPADLKVEIDRMKKQIAAMERTKGKTSTSSVLGKSSRVLSTDTSRPTVLSGTDMRSGINLATTSAARPASVDLESMRLRIAAKESELQQRRQRLAVKGSESGKGGVDQKGSSGVHSSSIPSTFKSGQTMVNSIASADNPVGKALSDKAMSGFKKETHVRGDGIPALTLGFPAGANLGGLKKDSEVSGLDGCDDQHNFEDRISQVTAVQVGPQVSGVLGRQSLTKGIKRSRAEGDHREAVKMPRLDTGSLAERFVAVDLSITEAVTNNMTVVSNGGSSLVYSTKPSVPKRKVDSIQTMSGKGVSGMPALVVSPAGSEAPKKLKTSSGEELVGSGREDLFGRSKHHVYITDQSTTQVLPTLDIALGSTVLAKEKSNSAAPSITISGPYSLGSLGTLQTSMQPVPGWVTDTFGRPEVEAAPSLPLAMTVTENWRSLIAVQKNSLDALTSIGMQTNGIRGEGSALGREHGIWGTKVSHVFPPISEDSAFTTCSTQPVVHVRHMERTAHCTTIASTEKQQKTWSASNLNSNLSADHNRVHTTLSWRPVNPLLVTASKYLEPPAEHSFQPSHTRVDDQRQDAEHDSFQHLLEQEELLDKELEEAQEIRQQCELKERVARREYREVQQALRAANVRCNAINQRKEFLLSRLHAAEASRYSVKSYLDGPLGPFGGPLVTHDQSKDYHPLSLGNCPSPLPVRQEFDIVGNQDLSGQVHDSLSPPSSRRVDIADFAHRNVHPVVSTEVLEDCPSSTWAMQTSLDGMELKSSAFKMIAEAECSGKLEDNHDVEEKMGHTTSVAVERQQDIEAGTIEDLGGHVGIEYFTSCAIGFNGHGMQNSASADLENSTSGLPYLAAEGQNLPANRAYPQDTIVNELPESTVMEDNVAVPQKSSCSSPHECARRCTKHGIIDEIGIGSPECGTAIAGRTETDGHAVHAWNEDLTGLDARKLSSRDVKEEGRDQIEQVSALTIQQDSQNVGLLPSALNNPSLVPDSDTVDVQAYVSTGELILVLDDQTHDDSSANVSSMNEKEYAVCTLDARVPVGTDCSDQMNDRPSALQQEVFLENENEAVGLSRNGDAEVCSIETPTEKESFGDLQAGSLKLSSERGGADIVNLEPLVEGCDEGFSSSTAQQLLSHLPESTTYQQSENGLSSGSSPRTQSLQQTLLGTEQVDSLRLRDPGMGTVPPHPQELEVQHLNEACQGQDSPQLLHSAGAVEGSVLPDLESHGIKGFEVSHANPGLQLAADVEFPTGLSHIDNSVATEWQSHLSKQQANLEIGLLSIEHPGTSVRIIKDTVSVDSLRELSPDVPQVYSNETSIALNQLDEPASEGRGCPGDSSLVVVQLIEPRIPNDSCRLQWCADSIDQREVRSEACQHPSMKIAFDDDTAFDRASSLSDSEDMDIVPMELETVGMIVDTEMITGNTKTLTECQFEVQEAEVAMVGEATELQQDPPTVDLSESEELKGEDVSKKESKNGADVEVFRKALLDGNVFEKRPCSGEVLDIENPTKQNRDDVSEGVLPQLRHHRLEHLLAIVDVRGPELSLGGDLVVQEDVHGSRHVVSPKAVGLQGDCISFERNTLLSQSTLQRQVFNEEETTFSTNDTEEPVGNKLEQWVPSAASLTVLNCSPEAVVSMSETDHHSNEVLNEERGSQSSSGESALDPRYESPLSAFRSYRTCPQFSGALGLSCSSTTWSHSINPFKPLCKFEHRGTCINDDCPWQHTDDYTLSSSQLESQIQHYSASSRLNRDNRGVAVTCFSEDADSAMSDMLSRSLDSSDTELITSGQTTATPRVLPKSSRLQSLSQPNWNSYHAVVPIYRTGSYTLMADDPTKTSLSYRLHIHRKVNGFHSFLLSPSIHRPLLLDMPCLLDVSESLSWSSGATPLIVKSPHRRYMGDIQKKLVFVKDGVVNEHIDEEMWLELALHQIDYDISSDDDTARDQALFCLSRALETNPSSVALWIVYSFLFHTRKENPERDDMFRHAVQYNQGSYELWILYINSRPDLLSRLEAYEKAITALTANGILTQLDKEELSACVLDIGLQMLYCMCISGRTEDMSIWVDDLTHEASVQNDLKPLRNSTACLLSCLTPHDACILWLACAYFSACTHLPTSIIMRLGCKQELPYGLDWEKHAKGDDVSHRRVINALSAAASEGIGCLSLTSRKDATDEHSYSRQILGVNYVQCLAFIEGLDSAARLGEQLISLYPNSLELIVTCARIYELNKGPSAGLHIFDEVVSQWPSSHPGFQRFWNLYAGHALLWGGKDLAKSVLLKYATTAGLHSHGWEEGIPSRAIQLHGPVSRMSLDDMEASNCKKNPVDSLGELREYFASLTSLCNMKDGGTVKNEVPSHLEDTIFSLMNLALVEALSGDIAASHLAMNRAMKAAISQKDSNTSWRELSSLQQVFSAEFPGWGDSNMLEQSMLSLIDRCKTDYHILSVLKPVSRKVLENFKKSHVRKIFEDLVGPPPLDHSMLNSILGALYGPQLLPFDSHALKEVFHFAEGILEAMPGNVLLASSLCKIVDRNRKALKRMYLSAAIWACALLISSLYQSRPIAPEVYWVEAGLLLQQLGEESSLEEFYGHALAKYPFSAALQHGLKDVRSQLQMPDSGLQGARQECLNLVGKEPIQVGAAC